MEKQPRSEKIKKILGPVLDRIYSDTKPSPKDIKKAKKLTEQIDLLKKLTDKTKDNPN